MDNNHKLFIEQKLSLMADTVMKTSSPYKEKWCYENGLALKALELLWRKTGDEKYIRYIKDSVDSFIQDDGSILTYRSDEYNIDQINEGKILFNLYELYKEEKYRKAAIHIREQLNTHPRTKEGGFWHKNIYPNQMWLDGIYMASPFLAEYALKMSETEAFDDVVNQILLIDKYTYDKNTGLLYHGWDESRQQAWSDKETGCSPNFWGRAIGWYVMAIVDVLDFLPLNHAKRQDIENILKRTIETLNNYRDLETGLWYQVLDKGGATGNYLETSASCMFIYSMAKAARKGYIDIEYKQMALKAYENMIKLYFSEDADLCELDSICKVAGLGGTPYRDGSYEYYISEAKGINDYKGVGPFIMAGVELL